MGDGYRDMWWWDGLKDLESDTAIRKEGKREREKRRKKKKRWGGGERGKEESKRRIHRKSPSKEQKKLIPAFCGTRFYFIQPRKTAKGGGGGVYLSEYHIIVDHRSSVE